MRAWHWLPALLVLCIAGVGLLLARDGATGFDEVALLWFRDSQDTAQIAGPAWAAALWKGISWLGDATPRISAAVLAVIALLWLHRWLDSARLAGLLVSGNALSSVIKHWVERPRPQLVAHLDQVSSSSFPSGHALNSTLFYLAIALLLAHGLRRRGARWAVYGAAIALSLAVGISRVALGVHYPSDVLASWLIAAAWLWLWFAAVKPQRPSTYRQSAAV